MQKSARKSATLNLNTQFRRVYKSGVASVRPTLVLYTKQNGLKINRLGITVSKKIGKACVRNRAKRRIREVYRAYQTQLKCGFDFVIVARGRTSDAPFSHLNSDFLIAANELKVFKDE
ncbi:MAG: ribonuclease P protein component [Clostridia bacterium]|nr:ribonuclease P protein component [Clostridia bacterium]